MFQTIFSFLSRSRSVPAADMNDTPRNWFPAQLKWRPTSSESLQQAEEKILSYVTKPFTLRNLPIPGFGTDTETCEIRTLTMEVEEKDRHKTPLVLLHGLGSAVGLWVMNLDDLVQQGPVHALDIPGFGMSSRPDYGSEAADVEAQMVDSIEKWRKEMNLDKFTLMGHSMGGYLASAYAMKHPEMVTRLILADPWGFPARDSSTVKKIQLPLWVKAIASVLRYFNPFAALRAAGPFGPGLVSRFRPDILEKFRSVVDDPDAVSNYIYHCNAQSPTGETAFKKLSDGIGWAKLPMISRIDDLAEDIPIHFIYGSRSWVDSHSGYSIKDMRDNVEVTMIADAGHHLYADHPDVFNSVVLEACQHVNNFTFVCQKKDNGEAVVDETNNEVKAVESSA